MNFEVDGAGELLAVGNGNAATTESFQANHRKAFSGKCVLIVKSKKGEAGEIRITAKSEGLATENISIEANIR